MYRLFLLSVSHAHCVQMANEHRIIKKKLFIFFIILWDNYVVIQVCKIVVAICIIVAY